MMRGDGIDDLRRFTVLARQLRADDRVRTFDFMIHGLADIVQQRGPARLFFIQTQLRRHRTANERRFDGMEQHVLRVTVTILEPAQELDDLRMNAVNTDIENRLLTGLANRLVELLLRFAHDFFDTAGMNAAVGDQFFQR